MKEYFALSLFAFLMSACSKSAGPTGNPTTPASPLTSDIDGKTIRFSSGQRFSLELDLHADGGYQWDCEISDTNIICVDSTGYRPGSRDELVVGGLTVETIHFRTKNPGHCTVSLNERRGWEKDVPPINSLRFQVSVVETAIR
jgi:predicted secreted protein